MKSTRGESNAMRLSVLEGKRSFPAHNSFWQKAYFHKRDNIESLKSSASQEGQLSHFPQPEKHSDIGKKRWLMFSTILPLLQTRRNREIKNNVGRPQEGRNSYVLQMAVTTFLQVGGDNLFRWCMRVLHAWGDIMSLFFGMPSPRLLVICWNWAFLWWNSTLFLFCFLCIIAWIVGWW